MSLVSFVRAALRRPAFISFVSRRNCVAGQIGEEPPRMQLGWLKMCLCLGLTTYAGGWVAKNGAAFLEENEIFVPEDDDDD